MNDLRPTRHYRTDWWAMPSAHATQASPGAVLRRLRHSVSVAIARNAFPAALGFIAGMMSTVGLAYVWSMFL